MPFMARRTVPSIRLQDDIKGILDATLGLIVLCERRYVISEPLNPEGGEIERVEPVWKPVDEQQGSHSGMHIYDAGQSGCRDERCHDTRWHALEVVRLDNDNEGLGGTARWASIDGKLLSGAHKSWNSSDKLPSVL